MLRTEGQGEHATVLISHETLFEAWPLLKDYIDKNKKQLIDRTLLEKRAKRWAERGGSWFDGLASGRECREFYRTNVTPTQEMKEYLHASRRARWMQAGIMGFVILLVGGPIAWMGKEGVTVQYAGSIVRAWFYLVQVPEPDQERMVAIPRGTYQPGDRSERSEHSDRKATIKPFAIGKYEVTFEEYDRYVELTRSKRPDDQRWGRGRRPVINVSWDDAKAYAKWLSRATGRHYRLSTEWEWEYAARSIAKIWMTFGREHPRRRN